MEGAPQSVESKNTNKSRVCQKVQPMPKHDRLQVRHSNNYTVRSTKLCVK